MMNEYTIEIYEVNPVTGAFTRIDELSTFYNLSFSERLNAVGMASFSLNAYDEKATTRNLKRFKNQILIKRNSTPVWVGTIANVSGTIQDVDNYVEVICYSYLYHLKTRRTGEVYYTQIDAGQIAWNLINDTQNKMSGKLGIASGTIQTTMDRDRGYQKKVIGDAIIDLTNVINGFDFSFDPVVNAGGLLGAINFNVYENIGRVRSDLPPITMQDNINTISWNTTSEFINTVTYEGAGSGDTIMATRYNQDFQIAYTRREDFTSRKDIKEVTTLDEKVAETIEEEKNERYALDIELLPDASPKYREYNVGDTLNINLYTEPSSYLNMQGQAVVTEIEVRVDNNGTEFVSPTFELKTDAN